MKQEKMNHFFTQINPAAALQYSAPQKTSQDVLCVLKLYREEKVEHIPHPESSVSAVLLPLGTFAQV